MTYGNKKRLSRGQSGTPHERAGWYLVTLRTFEASGDILLIKELLGDAPHISSFGIHPVNQRTFLLFKPAFSKPSPVICFQAASRIKRDQSSQLTNIALDSITSDRVIEFSGNSYNLLEKNSL